MNAAKLIAKALVKSGKVVGVKACVLIKVTPGARVDGSLSQGNSPTETPYAAKGWIEEYSDSQIDGTLVAKSDRKISILGATIGGKQVPTPNDKITIADPNGVVTTYCIVPDGVKSDPIGAVYICQGRA